MDSDFFKKKDKDRRRKDEDFSGAGSDDLEFDDIDSSGEFLSEDGPPQQSSPPPPPQSAPPMPHQAPPPVSPALPPVVPRPPHVADDITIVNAPPPPPTPASPPALPPAPPSAPRSPAGPVPPTVGATGRPPAPPQAAPPPPASSMSDDEVTQVLNTPVGREPLVAWLVVASGPGRGQDYRLPGGMLRIGMNPTCEICLAGDTFISTQHAEVCFRGGEYWLRDLNSTNGVFVNEARISEIALNDGDRVKMGTTCLVFRSLKL